MPDNYIITEVEKGTIHISEDVIATVVGAALAECDGVAGLASTVGGDLTELLGKKSVSKGIKITFEDGKILVDVIILVHFGSNIVSVAKKVQEKIVSELESMTGLSSEVNVRVSGVTFDKN